MSEAAKLKRYDCFDGVRGIGAVVVIFSHLPLIVNGGIYNVLWQLEHATRFGYLMLDQFFLMSGFFISRILLKERGSSGTISLQRFYARRFLRIFPIYYIAIMASYYIFHLKTAELISLSTYTFNYYHTFLPVPNPLEHTWSLSVEEQFYIFWPLLLGTIPLGMAEVVTGRVIPVIAIVSGLCIAVAVGSDDPVLSGNLVYTSLCTRMLSLSLGGWLAVREFHHKPLENRQCVALALMGLTLLMIDLSARSYGVIASQALYWTIALISYAMISVSLTSVLVFNRGKFSNALRSILEIPMLRSMGSVAYALYLFHLPVLYYLHLNAAAMGDKKADLLTVVEAVALTFTLAILSQFLIERPFMSMRRYFNPSHENQAVKAGSERAHPLKV